MDFPIGLNRTNTWFFTKKKYNYDIPTTFLLIPAFSAYIKTFYPQSTKFEVKPYKDYFDIIIHIGDGNLVLPLDNYFKKLKKIFK